MCFSFFTYIGKTQLFPLIFQDNLRVEKQTALVPRLRFREQGSPSQLPAEVLLGMPDRVTLLCSNHLKPNVVDKPG